jgi:hypothetical protein
MLEKRSHHSHSVKPHYEYNRHDSKIYKVSQNIFFPQNSKKLLQIHTYGKHNQLPPLPATIVAAATTTTTTTTKPRLHMHNFHSCVCLYDFKHKTAGVQTAYRNIIC